MSRGCTEQALLGWDNDLGLVLLLLEAEEHLGSKKSWQGYKVEG